MRHLARQDRIFNPRTVAERDPKLILASWCDRNGVAGTILDRPGFAATAAVRDDQLYEVNGSLILQPGPAALSEEDAGGPDRCNHSAWQTVLCGARGRVATKAPRSWHDTCVVVRA